MVMLLDYYEHNFKFSDSPRCKVTVDSKDFLAHIDEIQKAFLNHKIKLCSAFARNRIKACALTLEALLPLEVKEKGECGSKHMLHARINTLLTNKQIVDHKLTEDGFKEQKDFSEPLDEAEKCYYSDEYFNDLLVFSVDAKDDVYNHDLTLDYLLIPQVHLIIICS